MQDVLMQQVLVAVYSGVMGYLFGALVYLISGAFWLQDEALGEPRLRRAVVRVPESRCLSLRCAFTRPGQTEHLVEVCVLERGTTLAKVEWPSSFEHLEEWIYVSDVVEELNDHTSMLADDLERWLTTLGSEDPGDAHVLPTSRAAVD